MLSAGLWHFGAGEESFWAVSVAVCCDLNCATADPCFATVKQNMQWCDLVQSSREFYCELLGLHGGMIVDRSGCTQRQENEAKVQCS